MLTTRAVIQPALVLLLWSLESEIKFCSCELMSRLSACHPLVTSHGSDPVFISAVYSKTKPEVHTHPWSCDAVGWSCLSCCLVTGNTVVRGWDLGRKRNKTSNRVNRPQWMITPANKQPELLASALLPTKIVALCKWGKKISRGRNKPSVGLNIM